jgi:DNA-binding protein Fis
MKHVTLKVDSASSPGPTDRFASVIPSHRAPQSVEANACLSIEVRLSSARAQLLVDLLLELEREEQHGSGVEELIGTLLRNQLKDSDHLAGELFDKVISNVEKVVIQHAYENCNQVQTRTAEHLGIDRNTLHKKLRRYNLLK